MKRIKAIQEASQSNFPRRPPLNAFELSKSRAERARRNEQEHKQPAPAAPVEVPPQAEKYSPR